MNPRPALLRKHRALLFDSLLAFFAAALLIRPWFQAKYLQSWASIASTFIADGRFLAGHWPHPLWQPLWYCGTRFDYVYPPALRYGTALLSAIFIPVKAYHIFTGILFCLGIAGVLFMVRAMGGSRPQALFSAIACLLVSPSFLFLPKVAHDSPWLMPWRLDVLVRYGEGPHISALSLLPFALGFTFLALRRWRPGALALASLFSALVVLTNFYGATALAIFYPILVWSVWVTQNDRTIAIRALAIPALAGLLTAFWLTPAYFRITFHNLRYVSQPGSLSSYALTMVAAVLFGAASLRWARGKPQLAFLLFASGCVLFMGLNVLGHYYFNFLVVGDPARFVPELDMAMDLFAIEVLRRVWLAPRAPAHVRLARAIVILVALPALWPVVRYLPHAWQQYSNEPDYRSRPEYRVSRWMATHLPEARSFVSGSTRFWWDAWYDDAEVAGGSDQGLINPNPMAASWEVVRGANPDLSTRWMQALGADTIVVAGKQSQDAYRDIVHPEKFAGFLPVLYDDHQGNVIYKVPRRYPSLARVLDRKQLDTFKPIESATFEAQLRAYSDFVEHGPDIPTLTHWNGTDSLSVHAPVAEGESVLVQVTYDPSWRAYAGRTELPLRQDAMDFMIVDAPPGTQDITMVFQKPLGNRIGSVVSAAAALLCLLMGFMAIRTDDGPGIRPPADDAAFDPERLREAEAALPGEERLAKMLALVPPPQSTGRALELQCGMRITPLLESLRGYREVRGAEAGRAGEIEHRTVNRKGGEFSCYIDRFDFERDEFPWPGEYFDLIVAPELALPSWTLRECRRVLAEGGYLLVSSPNAASAALVESALEGRNPHSAVPAFTAAELTEALGAAGFEVEKIFTTFTPGMPDNRELLRLMAAKGYEVANRGDRLWCLARRKTALR